MQEQSSEQTPLPIEVIFSCGLCHATLDEIYEDAQYDKGFREDNSLRKDQSRQVTRLWLTECAHVICAKHLDGGGVPFHPPDQSPRAPCPVCSLEKNDRELKALYGIRGYKDGEFDRNIPRNWFDIPPVKLTSGGKGMDAMRFHYLSLSRFGTGMLKNFRNSKLQIDALERKLLKETKARRHLQEKNNVLGNQSLQFEQAEKKLAHWKTIEPKVAYYLGLMPEIARENEKLREQLDAMGYSVPKRSISYQRSLENILVETESLSVSQEKLNTSSTSDIETSQLPRQDKSPEYLVLCQGNPTTSSRTLSTGRTLSATNQPSNPTLSVSLEELNRHKRKRNLATFEEDGFETVESKPPYVARKSSREIMPPPPLPNPRNPIGGDIPTVYDETVSSPKKMQDNHQARIEAGQRMLSSDYILGLNEPHKQGGSDLTSDVGHLQRMHTSKEVNESRLNLNKIVAAEHHTPFIKETGRTHSPFLSGPATNDYHERGLGSKSLHHIHPDQPAMGDEHSIQGGKDGRQYLHRRLSPGRNLEQPPARQYETFTKELFEQYAGNALRQETYSRLQDRGEIHTNNLPGAKITRGSRGHSPFTPSPVKLPVYESVTSPFFGSKMLPRHSGKTDISPRRDFRATERQSSMTSPVRCITNDPYRYTSGQSGLTTKESLESLPFVYTPQTHRYQDADSYFDRRKIQNSLDSDILPLSPYFHRPKVNIQPQQLSTDASTNDVYLRSLRTLGTPARQRNAAQCISGTQRTREHKSMAERFDLASAVLPKKGRTRVSNLYSHDEGVVPAVGTRSGVSRPSAEAARDRGSDGLSGGRPTFVERFKFGTERIKRRAR